MNGTAQPAEPAPGTAEQLARLTHFSDLDLPEIDELGDVARFVIGNVGGRAEAMRLWNTLATDCRRLWHLLTDDWDDRDLDDLDDRDAFPGMSVEQAVSIRYERTRERLVGEIENAVWLARYRATEIACTAAAS